MRYAVQIDQLLRKYISPNPGNCALSAVHTHTVTAALKGYLNMSSGGFIAIKRKNKKHRKYIYHMFDRDIRQLKQYGKLLKEEKEFDIPSALRLLDDLHTRGYFSSKYLSSTERDIAKQIIARALKTLRNNVQKIIETSEIIRDKHGFLEYFMDLSKVQFKSRYSELFGDKQELP